MDANIIRELARLTLSGGVPFPEIVGRLIAEGVEYYHVDYVRLQFAFYGIDGGVVVAPLTIEGLPEVASELDGPQLRAAILDSQQNNQPFSRFSVRAMEAGVQAYYAFLRGKRVSYLGRNGDCHVEWFPGALHEDE
ncbi:DUF1398 family protein [Iodobacter sp. LRB]|uniref:DUF1398 family protein n=1 Tax=unclassified Iodobacter TaxID=235634 RepID=UPI000C1203D4|nr:DUF1398 family protein [Iodobacter sp. BJB302]PHV00728.1 DUF1398 domain-containing protein [Iodobacter sp. BJB302]